MPFWLEVCEKVRRWVLIVPPSCSQGHPQGGHSLLETATDSREDILQRLQGTYIYTNIHIIGRGG